MPEDWEEGSPVMEPFWLYPLCAMQLPWKKPFLAPPSRCCDGGGCHAEPCWPSSPYPHRSRDFPCSPLHCLCPVLSERQQRGCVPSPACSKPQRARKRHLIPSQPDSGGTIKERRKLRKGFFKCVCEVLGVTPVSPFKAAHGWNWLESTQQKLREIKNSGVEYQPGFKN